MATTPVEAMVRTVVPPCVAGRRWPTAQAAAMTSGHTSAAPPVSTSATTRPSTPPERAARIANRSDGVRSPGGSSGGTYAGRATTVRSTTSAPWLSAAARHAVNVPSVACTTSSRPPLPARAVASSTMPASATTGPATAVQRSRSSASCAASGSTPREETRCTSAPDRAAARAAPAARATTASSASLEPAGPTTTTRPVRSRFSRSTTTGSPRRAVVRQCTAVPSPGDQARRECTSGPDRAMVTGPSSPSPTSAADCTGTGSTPAATMRCAACDSTRVRRTRANGETVWWCVARRSCSPRVCGCSSISSTRVSPAAIASTTT